MSNGAGKKSKNRRLRSALRHASRGWPILPLFGIAHGQCECGDQKCRRPGKHPRTAHGLKDATTARRQIKRWWKEHPRSNVGILTGRSSRLLVIDIDGDRGKRAWKKLLKHCECLSISTLTAVTGNGFHYFFAYDGAITNSAGKLGPEIDVRGEGGYVVGVGSTHSNGRHYAWKDSAKAVAPLPSRLQRLLAKRERGFPFDIGNKIPCGKRNTTLTSFAGAMRRPGMSQEAIEVALLLENRNRCEFPLTDVEVKQIAASVARYAPATAAPSLQWPAPLDSTTIYGVAGEIVSAIAPFSEVDPVGLLLHILVFFGNAAGGSAHFVVASDRHPLNLFAVMVGDTAKARKGLAFNHAKQLFQIAAPDWTRSCIETGISSGEGLISLILKRTVGSHTPNGPSLLVFEPELGTALRRMQLPGNTSAQVLRQAWDSSPLGILTRKDPLKAESSYLSFIGHITSYELKELLARRDVFGGSANRMLWTCVRRHGVHPELGGLPADLLKRFGAKIASAIDNAKTVGKLSFSSEAERRWERLYPTLSSEDQGAFGATVSRGESQTLRLSGIFCLLDKSTEVRVEHLEAATAVWRYCRESAGVIFGARRSVGLEDQILTMLQNSASGLNRTEISEAFDNHKSSESISQALQKLKNQGRANRIVKPTKGRPAEVWCSVSSEVME